MKFAIAYYLLLIYATVILKSIIPLVKDSNKTPAEQKAFYRNVLCYTSYFHIYSATLLHQFRFATIQFFQPH